MRKHLAKIANNSENWHVYGLSIDDYDYIINAIEGIIDDREKVLQEQLAEIKSTADKEIVDEVVSDIAYYNHIERQYLWEFLVIRLIGIFEGIIQKKFLKEGNFAGLKSRMDGLKASGYSLNNEKEIILWGKLRNALAHRPPEQYRPAFVTKEDVYELKDLLIAEIKFIERQRG